MARCLTAGVIREWVRASAGQRREAVAAGRELIVGASAFVEEPGPASASPSDLGARPQEEAASRASGLEAFRLAEPYEEETPR